MAKVLGIGGVFFKAADPQAVRDWYAHVLGMDVNEWGCTFETTGPSTQQWSVHAATTDYYDPSTHEAQCAADLGVPGYDDCKVGPKSYIAIDPDTGLSRKFVEKGKFIGAHMDGYNIP